jgi:hypothetical protein
MATTNRSKNVSDGGTQLFRDIVYLLVLALDEDWIFLPQKKNQMREPLLIDRWER